MKFANFTLKLQLTQLVIFAMAVISIGLAQAQDNKVRPRARDVGLVVGTLQTGKYNAITDVDGVLVGHSTVIKEPNIHTGVTAIIPAPGNLYKNPVPAWIHAGNGYGKSIGLSQLLEFGEIETPILLTCTLCVWTAADAMVDYLLQQPGEYEHTINPVVGETNDSIVSDMWSHPVQAKHVREALPSSMSPLFTATVEATEEAIYNALFKATTIEGRGNRLKSLPIYETVNILKKYNALNWDKTLPPGKH